MTHLLKTTGTCYQTDGHLTNNYMRRDITHGVIFFDMRIDLETDTLKRMHGWKLVDV